MPISAALSGFEPIAYLPADREAVKDRTDCNERRERDQDDGRDTEDAGTHLIRAYLPATGPETDEAAKDRVDPRFTTMEGTPPSVTTRPLRSPQPSPIRLATPTPIGTGLAG